METTGKKTVNVIFTVFKSEKNLPSLFEAFEMFCGENSHRFNFNAVFVVDGSPDESASILRAYLPHAKFSSQLIELSKNFGAPLALRTGISRSEGDYFATYATDLQEPFEFLIRAIERIEKENLDIVFAVRAKRNDPLLSKLMSQVYWAIYKRYISSEFPKGGVDLFVFNSKVRSQVINSKERHSFFVGILFWLGFKRGFEPYERRKREIGKSSWSFAKKINYFLDSVFAFTPLPFRLLLFFGIVGFLTAALFTTLIIIAKFNQAIDVPGYAGTVVLISFFGGLNSMGFWIVGEYIWRIFDNTRERPLTVVSDSRTYPGELKADQ